MEKRNKQHSLHFFTATGKYGELGQDDKSNILVAAKMWLLKGSLTCKNSGSHRTQMSTIRLSVL